MKFEMFHTQYSIQFDLKQFFTKIFGENDCAQWMNCVKSTLYVRIFIIGIGSTKTEKNFTIQIRVTYEHTCCSGTFYMLTDGSNNGRITVWL